jgi:hypothetical protein
MKKSELKKIIKTLIQESNSEDKEHYIHVTSNNIKFLNNLGKELLETEYIKDFNINNGKLTSKIELDEGSVSIKRQIAYVIIDLFKRYEGNVVDVLLSKEDKELVKEYENNPGDTKQSYEKDFEKWRIRDSLIDELEETAQNSSPGFIDSIVDDMIGNHKWLTGFGTSSRGGDNIPERHEPPRLSDYIEELPFKVIDGKYKEVESTMTYKFEIVDHYKSNNIENMDNETFLVFKINSSYFDLTLDMFKKKGYPVKDKEEKEIMEGVVANLKITGMSDKIMTLTLTYYGNLHIKYYERILNELVKDIKEDISNKIIFDKEVKALTKKRLKAKSLILVEDKITNINVSSKKV